MPYLVFLQELELRHGDERFFLSLRLFFRFSDDDEKKSEQGMTLWLPLSRPLFHFLSLFFFFYSVPLFLLVLARSRARSLACLVALSHPSASATDRTNERAMPPLDKYPLERGTSLRGRLILTANFARWILRPLPPLTSLPPPFHPRHLLHPPPTAPQRSSRPFWSTTSTRRRISSST